MLSKFKQLYRAIQALKSENLGDYAILKADTLGARVNPSVESKLQNVVGYHPPIDLEKLIVYPKGSFGYEYAYHMKENHLKPFNVSPELEEIAKRNVFSLRYVVTHDIFHILLGFDTSYAGEIGVLAFAAEQKYSPSLNISLALAKVIYPILAPQQRKEIFANIRKGQELGRKAEFLLGVRFEEYWERPLNEVKAELGLMAPARLTTTAI
ncbi:MAG TPA: Coq4 family protein [Coleofasciculaceae cyanobacterium]|jgi:ubiquinone biosynthesis protein Coq4